MRKLRSWLVRPLHGLFAMFGLKVIRNSAYQATMARNRDLEAQMAGFVHVMEQDYRLIHDLFHADQRLRIDD